MPNIMQVLKAEITRLAKKQTKSMTTVIASELRTLKKAQKALKNELQAVKRQLATSTNKNATPTLSDKEIDQARLGPALIKKLRKKLELSQADLAKLIGVSLTSIALWESGKTSPTKANKAKIVALRGMSKRELKKTATITSR